MTSARASPRLAFTSSKGDTMPGRTLRALRSAGSRAMALGASAVVVAALASPVSASASAVRPHDHQRVAVHILTAHLNGQNEVPTADPNGTGNVVVRLRPALGKVCAHATWHRIGKPIMAHIHRGRAGVSGNVLVDLTGSVTGGSNCVTGVSKALIRHILDHPRRFYYNIHTNAYPAGAIRGQLHG
jgi:CHRD domain